MHDASVLPAASLVRAAMADGLCRLECTTALVPPAASLVRAAMTDGPCCLKCTMYPCYHHLARYHISITVKVKWLMPQYRQTAARTFVGGYCSIS